MTQMTSRQRALMALNHQEPDRIPIDIGGLVLFTCWHKEAQERAKAFLGYKGGENIINSIISQTVQPDARIRDRFQTDFFGLLSGTSYTGAFDLEVDEEGGYWFLDEWGCKWRCPPGGHYYDIVEHPLAGATVAEVARFQWPDPSDPARLVNVIDRAKDLYHNTDYCLCYTPVWATGIFAVAGFLQGWDNLYVNLIADKPVTRAILDGLVEFHLGQWESILDAVGDYIQVGMMSDDLGFQDRPMIRLELFRELLLPAYKRVVTFIKSRKPNLKLVFHSDGVIEQFLPDFIDIGLDAINPVQIGHQSIADLARFKLLYGDKLTFWGGGIDTQHTLPRGTVDEVRAEVRERISYLAPGGGHIFAAIHNVQFDVPPRNIQACYDAALEFGKYPIAT